MFVFQDLCTYISIRNTQLQALNPDFLSNHDNLCLFSIPAAMLNLVKEYHTKVGYFSILYSLIKIHSVMFVRKTKKNTGRRRAMHYPWSDQIFVFPCVIFFFLVLLNSLQVFQMRKFWSKFNTPTVCPNPSTAPTPSTSWCANVGSRSRRTGPHLNSSTTIWMTTLSRKNPSTRIRKDFNDGWALFMKHGKNLLPFIY